MSIRELEKAIVAELFEVSKIQIKIKDIIEWRCGKNTIVKFSHETERYLPKLGIMVCFAKEKE
jgi:hypothetical protein